MDLDGRIGMEQSGIQDTKRKLLGDGIIEKTHMLNVESLLNFFSQKQAVAGVVDLGLVNTKGS